MKVTKYNNYDYYTPSMPLRDMTEPANQQPSFFPTCRHIPTRLMAAYRPSKNNAPPLSHGDASFKSLSRYGWTFVSNLTSDN
jgi:hypothetical protein